MKKYVSILLVLLVVAALSVSGCTMLGGNNNGGQATPVPTTNPDTNEPDATEEPTAQPTGGDVLSTVGQLFNMNNLNWYQFRMTSDVEGETVIATYKISMLGDTTYNGVAAEHEKFEIDMPAQEGQEAMSMEVETYTSKADQSSLGGHMKMIQNGETVMEMDIPASQAGTYTSQDITDQAQVEDDVVLSNAGPAVVIIDGKTYACTKYTYTIEDGTTYTVWHSPQAPLPVKSEWTGEVTGTMELIDWG